MLVLDSSAQGRWRGAAKTESRHESRRKALMQEIRSNTITVESDAGRDVTNLLAQLGREIDVLVNVDGCLRSLTFAAGIDVDEWHHG